MWNADAPENPGKNSQSAKFIWKSRTLTHLDFSQEYEQSCELPGALDQSDQWQNTLTFGNSHAQGRFVKASPADFWIMAPSKLRGVSGSGGAAR